MPLNINLQQILLHALNFVILFGAMYFLLYKPVKDYMESRKAHYVKMDEDAKAALAEAEQTKAQYAEQLKAADEEIARVRSNDVLIGISFPRYSTRTVEAMRFARKGGAQVISITDGPMSPLHDVSDVCLTARTDMASFVDSLAAPMSVINALIVSLGLHRKEELGRHFKQLEAIWAANDVYLGEEHGHME